MYMQWFGHGENSDGSFVSQKIEKIDMGEREKKIWEREKKRQTKENITKPCQN